MVPAGATGLATTTLAAPRRRATSHAARTVDPVPEMPPPRAVLPTAPERRRGPWLVVLVYLMSAAALGYAIWERFLR